MVEFFLVSWTIVVCARLGWYRADQRREARRKVRSRRGKDGEAWILKRVAVTRSDKVEIFL